jgi:hypothetical protein
VPSAATAGEEKITPPVAVVFHESVGFASKEANGNKTRPKTSFRGIESRAKEGVMFGIKYRLL